MNELRILPVQPRVYFQQKLQMQFAVFHLPAKYHNQDFHFLELYFYIIATFCVSISCNWVHFVKIFDFFKQGVTLNIKTFISILDINTYKRQWLSSHKGKDPTRPHRFGTLFAGLKVDTGGRLYENNKIQPSNNTKKFNIEIF